MGNYLVYVLGYQIDVCYGNGKVHLVRARNPEGSYPIYYIQGTISGSTISWVAWRNATPSLTSLTKPAVAVDTNGYPWVCYTREGTDQRLYCTKATNTEGTAWETPFGLVPDQGTGYIQAEVVPLSAGKMVAIMGRDNYRGRYRIWTPTTPFSAGWGALDYCTALKCDVFDTINAWAYGDDIYVFYEDDSTEGYSADKHFAEYTSGAWQTEVHWTIPTFNKNGYGISVDALTGIIYVFYFRTDTIFCYRMRKGGVWSSEIDIYTFTGAYGDGLEAWNEVANGYLPYAVSADKVGNNITIYYGALEITYPKQSHKGKGAVFIRYLIK